MYTKSGLNILGKILMEQFHMVLPVVLCVSMYAFGHIIFAYGINKYTGLLL